ELEGEARLLVAFEKIALIGLAAEPCQIGALPAFRVVLDGKIDARMDDGRGRIEILVRAPVFPASTVVEIARDPDVAWIADDPYCAKRVCCKGGGDQR